MNGKKALLVYVEPTPYILGLVSMLNRLWPAGVEVLFMKENVSQAWGLELDRRQMTVLPGGLTAGVGLIRSRLDSGAYGIVHLAGWAPLLMPASMLLSRCRQLPVTVETDTPLPAGLPLWKRLLKSLLYPLLFRLPATFLPGGKRQAAYLRHYGVGEERIVPANMTVDVASISRHVDGFDPGRRSRIRADLGVPSEATVFLYVGRLEPHKGLQELLDAFSRLPAEDGPVSLLLVGDGSLREMLDRAMSADPRIRWPGRLSGTALWDAYAAADVFVLPSRFEPWGLVVNEAMAAGLPVIASDRVGCVDDLVRPGETGLLVQAESAPRLASAMTSLRDEGLRKNMSRNARRLIGGWTLENEAAIIVNTWERLRQC